MTLPSNIEINPDVMLGKPAIRGTRIIVETVLGRSADGYTIQQVLDNNPHISREDVTAALRYAADRMASPPEIKAA